MVALISDDHLRRIAWKDDLDHDGVVSEDEEEDREFAFEVTKHNEEEENVTGHPGFRVSG